MKSVLLTILCLAALNFIACEDDGQYHPELYGGDDGSYHPSDDGRYYNDKINAYNYYNRLDNHYRNLFGRFGSYNDFEPAYYRAYKPYQQLLAPVVNYGDGNGIDETPYASAPVPVTYRPPLVVSTARAPVFSTARPSLTGLPVYARAHGNEAYANIVRQENDLDPNAYHYAYQTDNGIAAEESGRIDAPGGTRARGFYEYFGDDGKKYRVDYVADENGFRPVGAHLPKTLA